MRKLKSVLSLILALAMVFSCLTAIAADDDDDWGDDRNDIVSVFSDVDENTTVGRAITQLAMLGIISGYPDGTYLPEGSITRAEFAVICTKLNNTANGLPADAITGFSDLDNDDSYRWARPYVMMAVGQGVIKGYDDGTFRAGLPVTYEEAVTMLMRMKGYDTICQNETKKQQEFDYNRRWSVGYLTIAQQVGLLTYTTRTDEAQTQPVNRGDVAVLANNSMSVNQVQEQVNQQTGQTSWTVIPGGGPGGGGGGGAAGSNGSLKTINGTVTATYITSLDSDISELSRYEIVLDDDPAKKTYEVSPKVMKTIDTYELIGQKIRATYDDNEDMITALAINTPDNNITTIYSGYVSGSSYYYIGADFDGKIEYCTDHENEKFRTLSLNGYTVIYNGKYVDDFRTSDLADPDSPYFFKNGKIELINSGSRKIAKISNYETYVVKSLNTEDDIINLYYKTGSESHLDFEPDGASGEYFVFRRGTTNIEEITDLKRYDVLNILQSPKSARGTDVNITEVTRNSLTGRRVTGRGKGLENGIELNNKIYQYNYEYVNYDPETGQDEKYDLSVGDEGISVYFDHIGQIAAVAVSGSSSSATAWKYGYLLTLTQDKDTLKNKSYDLEFYIFDETGNRREIGAKSKISIDGTSYTSSNKNISGVLRDSADIANSAYMRDNSGDVTGQEFQQPIRYKLTSAGLMDEIDTVVENNKVTNDDLSCDFGYDGLQKYTSSGTRFNDFSVGSATKIIFVPDRRNDWDAYKMGSYSTMFTTSRSYHVEAYNVASTSSGSRGRADFVLIYKTDDTKAFNYRSNFMIVTGVKYGESDNELNKLTGYICAGSAIGASPRTYDVSREVSESEIDMIGPGDIIRFITDTRGDISIIDHWFDASNPIQDRAANSLEDAISARTMVYKSSTVGDPEPEDDNTAGFRLAYGTVTNLETDDKYITVSPTLSNDHIDMETDDTVSGNSVVRHKYSDSTVVFVRSRNGENVSKTTMGQAIDDSRFDTYADVEDGATRVITYTTGNTTSDTNGQNFMRFVYIIK